MNRFSSASLRFFAGADLPDSQSGFRLYDAVTDDGTVDEDVFAYSNVGPDGERSLVLFHNRYAETSVRIGDSVGFMARQADGERRLRRERLGEGLGLSGAPDRFVVLRDAMSGLEHLWSSAEIAGDGLRAELGPYRCHVFVDLAEMADGPRPVARLHAELGGRGVPSIDEALLGLELEPVPADVRARLAGAFEPVEAAAAPKATTKPTKKPTARATTSSRASRSRNTRSARRRLLPSRIRPGSGRTGGRPAPVGR